MINQGPERLSVPAEQEERPKPKLVYIAHRMGGDIPGNRKEVLRICSETLSPEQYPFAPYLVAFEYLDDSKQEQREMGMAMNRYFFEQRIIDEVLLCGPAISAGMKEEIKLAIQYGIQIRCHNQELERPLVEFIKQLYESK